jgi:2-amino-4-hydroxy-6-hydroxymethyldihydropteridine diphosphokinase
VTDFITVYLGLGTNLGDRKANLDKALGLLAERMQLGKKSSIYDTDPVGVVDQPRFLNMACQASTRLSPEGLLALVKGIEARMGRFGNMATARVIDVDILLRMAERAFALVPLAEIAPDVVHPKSGKKIKDLLKTLGEIKGVNLWTA